MSEEFLHGVEIVEIDDGTRPIETARSSIIGLIGTAPDSDAAATATLTTGAVVNDNALTWTATSEGVGGNNTGVYLKARGLSQALAVDVSNGVITVQLETDATGVVQSTAAEVLAAVNANTDAAALVTVSDTGESDGSGVAEASMRIEYLAGGLDEAFPLNTPVLVAGRRTDAARLGSTGTLPKAIDAIFDQYGAWVVVVRVAEGVDDAATISNIIGDLTLRTGVKAFLSAEPSIFVTPRILIAPTWGDEQAVIAEMIGVAEMLKAVVIADGPNTTDAAAIDYRMNFGSDRVYIVDPQVKTWDVATHGYEYRPASPRVAGIIAKSDNERGFWWSPSNREINGIVGTKRDIDFEIGNPQSRANYLNEHDVATIVRKEGWRLWGNRSCSEDPKWQFLSVRRTADMIHEALQRSHLWAVDRNITKTYMEDVVMGVRSFLNHLTIVGAVLGGTCWVDEELNSPESIANGRVYFDFDFTPPFPAERVTFRSHLTNQYIANLFPLRDGMSRNNGVLASIGQDIDRG
jgi:phage tail sheath protein FI